MLYVRFDLPSGSLPSTSTIFTSWYFHRPLTAATPSLVLRSIFRVWASATDRLQDMAISATARLDRVRIVDDLLFGSSWASTGGRCPPYVTLHRRAAWVSRGRAGGGDNTGAEGSGRCLSNSLSRKAEYDCSAAGLPSFEALATQNRVVVV